MFTANLVTLLKIGQHKTWTTDYGLRTTDYGLGIKHGLKYKIQTEVQNTD